MRHREFALRTKVEFESLMLSLRVKIPEEPIAFYESLSFDERAEEQLHMLRPILEVHAKRYGVVRYEEPTLSEESKMLLNNSPIVFTEQYERRLRRLDGNRRGIQHI